MPSNEQSKFLLFRGDTLLGTITHDQSRDDWPWCNGNFIPAEDFASAKPLFEKELMLLRARNYQEFDQLWEEIKKPELKIQLIRTGENFSVGLLHIDGDKISWRTMRKK
jgi:hypothetical protein